MIDEIIPIDLRKIKSINELHENMCATVKKGVLAFVMISRKGSIEFHYNL